MFRTLRHCAAVAGVTALLAAVPAAWSAQDPQAKSPAPGKGDAARKGPAQPRTVSGVIVKVEPIREGASPGSTTDDLAKEGKQPPRTLRFTLNSAVPWRDWVRDQATQPLTASPEKQAAEGNQSVATKGEPAEKSLLVVVDVAPATKVETRFRSSTDESSPGAKTPEAAARAQADPAAEPDAKAEARSDKAKPAQFSAGDLKPGLFVEVEYQHERAQNRAEVVRVLRPVGGPDTSAAEAKVPKAESAKPERSKDDGSR